MYIQCDLTIHYNIHSISFSTDKIMNQQKLSDGILFVIKNSEMSFLLFNCFILENVVFGRKLLKINHTYTVTLGCFVKAKTFRNLNLKTNQKNI